MEIERPADELRPKKEKQLPMGVSSMERLKQERVKILERLRENQHKLDRRVAITRAVEDKRIASCNHDWQKTGSPYITERCSKCGVDGGDY